MANGGYPQIAEPNLKKTDPSKKPSKKQSKKGDGRDEASIGTFLSERALIIHEESTEEGTKMKMFSYGIFVYIIVRTILILIFTHLAEILEAMLLNPGSSQDVIPRFGWNAFLLELVGDALLIFQAIMAMRVAKSKIMWESWVLVRVTWVIIAAQVIIALFQFMFSYQTYDAKPSSPNYQGQGYYSHGSIVRMQNTVKDLKESVGMLLFACALMVTACSVAFVCTIVNISYYRFHLIVKEHHSIKKKIPDIEQMISPETLYHQIPVTATPVVPTGPPV